MEVQVVVKVEMEVKMEVVVKVEVCVEDKDTQVGHIEDMICHQDIIQSHHSDYTL